MAGIEISRDDIIGLGNALDELSLPKGQKALLSAIVALASETLANKSEKAATVDGTGPAASFRDQFASSFVPARGTGDGGDGVKIGHNVGP